MRAALDDDVPEEWLSDSTMEHYNPESYGPVTSIEEGLSDALHESDVAAAASFIKDCLRLDPEKRLTARKCFDHEWLDDAGGCSCMYC